MGVDECGIITNSKKLKFYFVLDLAKNGEGIDLNSLKPAVVSQTHFLFQFQKISARLDCWESHSISWAESEETKCIVMGITPRTGLFGLYTNLMGS